MKRTADSTCFSGIIERRVSCREFVHNAPLAQGEIEYILRASSRAPTAGNLQAWQVKVLVEAHDLHLLAAAALGQEWIATASIALIFFADKETSSGKYRGRGRKLYALQDATIACSYAQLACEAIGLGACWVGAFREDQVLEIAGSCAQRDGLSPVALLIIGRPTATARKRPRSRKPITDMVL